MAMPRQRTRPTVSRTIRRAALFVIVVLTAALIGAPVAAQKPQVTIETSKGAIVVELDPAAAPKSVENFLRYARSGFYDGTVFHRVIPGFMIQGGGFTADLNKKPVGAPVENESKDGLSNTRGTIALARTMAPHSATAQFYINVVDNPNLDARGGQWGYAVFGRVLEGMNVVDAIAAVPTDFARAGGQTMRDVPTEAVTILKVTAP